LLVAGLPLTPRAGVTTPSAVTEDVKVRRNKEAAKDLESISIMNG